MGEKLSVRDQFRQNDKIKCFPPTFVIILNLDNIKNINEYSEANRFDSKTFVLA